MLKPYSELVKVDVKKYCDKRDGFLYLNWAKCIELLRENGAERAYFEPVPDEETGSALRHTDIIFKDKYNVENRCYETRIKVVIDDNTYYMQSPVMNGKNPVKDNSLNQQVVWNSMCRSFVKCVAIHTGLGFNMWVKNERPFDFEESDLPDTKNARDARIKMAKEIWKKNGCKPELDEWLKSFGYIDANETVEDMEDAALGKMLNYLKKKYQDE